MMKPPSPRTSIPGVLPTPASWPSALSTRRAGGVVLRSAILRCGCEPPLSAGTRLGQLRCSRRGFWASSSTRYTLARSLTCPEHFCRLFAALLAPAPTTATCPRRRGQVRLGVLDPLEITAPMGHRPSGSQPRILGLWPPCMTTARRRWLRSRDGSSLERLWPCYACGTAVLLMTLFTGFCGDGAIARTAATRRSGFVARTAPRAPNGSQIRRCLADLAFKRMTGEAPYSVRKRANMIPPRSIRTVTNPKRLM